MAIASSCAALSTRSPLQTIQAAPRSQRAWLLHTVHRSAAVGSTGRSGRCSRKCSALVEVEKKQAVVSVEDCLERMRQALGVDDLAESEQVNVTGKRVFLGMEGEWTFSWTSDGRFYEQFNNEEVTVDGGFDGKGRPWHADYAGRVMKMDLDDFETCLLLAWLRTGFWLSSSGQERVVVSLCTDSLARPSELILNLHIRDMKVVANVYVNTDTWLITRLKMSIFGGEDRWEYSDWRFVIPGSSFRFPCSVQRQPPAGGRDTFLVEMVEIGQVHSSLFELPSSSVIPRCNPSYPVVEFDENKAPTIKMVHTASGHYVVKPLVDDEDIGYFVVDTGASGLSIAPHMAENLSMHAFGEIYVSGVANQVKSRFFRGKRFQLGRMTILNPLYIEVGMEGVVRGLQPVSGICGFDMFHSCIVEMSMAERTLSLFTPSSYDFSRWPTWQTMYMLENVPHISAKFNGHETMFLLDTGAGGVDVIFPKKTVEKYDLLKSSPPMFNAKVRGVNASSGVQALFGELDSFEVGGLLFNRVRALFFKGDEGMMNFSVYTGGIICEQLLRSFLLVLDYQGCRISFVKPRDQK